MMDFKKNRSMVFVCVVLMLGLIIGAPLLAQTMPAVRVVPASATIAAGEMVEVQIVIEDVSQLYSVDLTFLYNASVLDVVDADPNKEGIQIAKGDFFGDGYEAENEAGDGQIDYIFAQLNPSPPVDGSGTLAIITFIGKADGVSALTLEMVAMSDPNGQGIPVILQNGTLTVGSATSPQVTPTPTPEPTAMPAPSTLVPTATPLATPIPLYPDNLNCGTILGYHIVRKGETVYSIARAYATHPRAIIVCNRLVNPAYIHRSNMLAIPVAPWFPVPPGPTAQAQLTPQAYTPTEACRYSHTVAAKETLTQLSGRYGTSVWAIARTNAIQNINLIYIGQTLCIP